MMAYIHRLIWVVFAFFLAACRPTISEPAAAPLAGSKDTPVVSPTVLPPTETPTDTPIPTLTEAVNTTTPTITATSSPTVDLPAPTETPCTSEACDFEEHFVFARPIGPEGNNTIDLTYRYGSTQDGLRRTHHGVELPNPEGTPVLAAGDGIVVAAGDDAHIHYARWYNHYGNVVILQHDIPGMNEPVYTLYAHLSAILTEEGAVVQAGDVIGQVGYTGRATGSHLHFEVRVGENDYDATRNPVLWLKPVVDPQAGQTGVLAGRIRTEKGTPWYFTDLSVERLDDAGEEILDRFYVETYADETVDGDDALDEDFALGDLLPGFYRIKFVANGLQSHIVEILPGQVTLFEYDAGSEE